MANSKESAQLAFSDTPEDAKKKITNLLALVAGIDPENVHCMMGIIVHKADEDQDNLIKTYAFGTDEDIARMLTTQITQVKKGITQLLDAENAPPTESKH